MTEADGFLAMLIMPPTFIFTWIFLSFILQLGEVMGLVLTFTVLIIGCITMDRIWKILGKMKNV